MLNAETGQLDFARVETFANVTNNLADSMATTEAKILNFVNRSAGVGQTFGILENDVAAFAAAFTALGIAPEKASNAFNTTAQRLAMATQLGDRAAEGFEQLGLSAAEMEAQFAAGQGTEAMMQFLTAVQQGGPASAAALSGILGQGFSDEILQAASGMGQFEQAFIRSQEAVAGGGSTIAESFNIIAQTSESSLAIMANAFKEISIALGPPILDAIAQIVGAITPLALKFAEFLQNNPKITQMGVAFLAVVAAIGPLLVIIGQIAIAISAIMPIITAIGAIIGAVFAAIFSPMFLFIALIAGVAAAAWAIISNWSAVKAFFADLWQSIVAGARALGVAVVAFASQAMAQFVARVQAGAAQVLSAIQSMGASILAAIRNVASQAFEAGASIVRRIAEGIRSAIGAVTGAIGAVGNAIRAALPGSPVDEGPLTILNNISSNPGAQIVDMLARGIESAAPALQSAIGLAGMGAVDVADGDNGAIGVPSPSVAGSGVSGPVTVNVYVSGVSNAQEAQAVGDVFTERVRRALKELDNNHARVSYA